MGSKSYHFNDSTGEANRCSNPDVCPFGPKTKHFLTVEETVASGSWTFRVKPPKRAASKITLNDVKSEFKRAAIDSLFDSEYSLREAWRVALRHFDGLCYLCGKSIYDRRTGLEMGTGDMKATADHIIPLAGGGITAAGNLAPAHFKCNNARANTPIDEYLAHNPEMLNRVRNFQKKYKFEPLSEEQLKELNDSIEIVWAGMKAQLSMLKGLL